MLVGECHGWLISFARYRTHQRILIELLFSFFIAEIHHLVHEQDGAAVSRATTQPSPINGLRQTRSTSKHKQRNHEATSQGTEYRSLQATKKKSGLNKEKKR
jgi:hypothetical protein